MSDPIAVLVEDDRDQSALSIGVLKKLGFDVRAFDAITPVHEYLEQSSDLIDLFVLDRWLPLIRGERATDELGDQLLRTVRADFKDARIIVFTGFATISLVQKALRGGGLLPTQDQPAIDRITVIEKSQSSEFESDVAAFRMLVQSFDDIEVTQATGAEALSYRDKRAIRRLAFEYRSTSVAVTRLGGGLTGDSVWQCDLSNGAGHVATVVAKRVKTAAARAGLPNLLPKKNAAATLATLSGLMGGDYLNVLQPAGKNAYPLMELIGSEPDKAVTVSQPLWDELRAIDSEKEVLTVAELCAPLIEWKQLSSLLAPLGVRVPPGTLRASTRIGLRPGDFHPLNVLVDGEDAVLIDYDGTTMASGLEDPMTMLVSTLIHPASPIRGAKWPKPEEIGASFGSPEFGRGHAQAAWFTGVSSWLKQCTTSEREQWAWALAYAGHELKFEAVTGDEEILQRVIAIARRAATMLGET